MLHTKNYGQKLESGSQNTQHEKIEIDVHYSNLRTSKLCVYYINGNRSWIWFKFAVTVLRLEDNIVKVIYAKEWDMQLEKLCKFVKISDIIVEAGSLLNVEE